MNISLHQNHQHRDDGSEKPILPASVLALPPDSASAAELTEFFTAEVILKRLLVSNHIRLEDSDGNLSPAKVGFIFVEGRNYAEAKNLADQYWLQGELDSLLPVSNLTLPVRAIVSYDFFPTAMFLHQVITENSRPETFKFLMELLGLSISQLKGLQLSFPTVSPIQDRIFR